MQDRKNKCKQADNRTEPCPAVICHGPGHQSKTHCHLTGQHDVHEARYGSFDQVARWLGPEKCTGCFDEPPREPTEKQKATFVAMEKEHDKALQARIDKSYKARLERDRHQFKCPLIAEMDTIGGANVVEILQALEGTIRSGAHKCKKWVAACKRRIRREERMKLKK